MKYKDILKQLSIKENVPVKEIEREMKAAIKLDGFDCSVKEFLQITTALAKDYI